MLPVQLLNQKELKSQALQSFSHYFKSRGFEIIEADTSVAIESVEAEYKSEKFALICGKENEVTIKRGKDTVTKILIREKRGGTIYSSLENVKKKI